MSGSPDQNGECTREFAWGVAHDFSNLVQVILGFAELMRTQHPEDAELQQCVEEIVTASDRARELVTQLRLIGRRCEPALEPTDLNALLQGMAAELTALLGPAAALQWRLQADVPRVPLDRACVERAVKSLCACARDAMGEAGTLTIATQQVHSGVQLTVQDNGGGYEPSAAKHLCEPFFIKRTLGRGNGLEFAVAQGVAEQHRGRMVIETAPGRGTTVQLYFPNTAA